MLPAPAWLKAALPLVLLRGAGTRAAAPAQVRSQAQAQAQVQAQRAAAPASAAVYGIDRHSSRRGLAGSGSASSSLAVSSATPIALASAADLASAGDSSSDATAGALIRVSGGPSTSTGGGLSAAVRAFVLWPPALGVGIAVACAVPLVLLLLVLPYAGRVLKALTPIDAFSMDRPLDAGEERRNFPSPLGGGTTCVYYAGTLGAAVIMLLAWVADNAVYSSSLRPLPAASSGGFAWSSVPAPLELAILFAADADAASSCSSVSWLGDPPPVTSADVLRVAPPATLTSPGSGLQPTLCLMRLTFDSFRDGAAGSALLLNASLSLPSSAQSVAWLVSGVLTPAARQVGANASVWTSGAVTAPATALRGVESVSLALGMMPIVETDEVLSRSSTGVIIASAAAEARPRTVAAFVPGADSDAVHFSLTVQPSAQLFSVTVIPRLSFAQLLGSVVGLLGGLGAVFRIVYKVAWKLRFRARGTSQWETEALAQQQAKAAAAAAAAVSRAQALPVSGITSPLTGLKHARGSAISRAGPGGLARTPRRGKGTTEAAVTAPNPSAAGDDDSDSGAALQHTVVRRRAHGAHRDDADADASVTAAPLPQPANRRVIALAPPDHDTDDLDLQVQVTEGTTDLAASDAAGAVAAGARAKAALYSERAVASRRYLSSDDDDQDEVIITATEGDTSGGSFAADEDGSAMPVPGSIMMPPAPPAAAPASSSGAAAAPARSDRPRGAAAHRASFVPNVAVRRAAEDRDGPAQQQSLQRRVTSSASAQAGGSGHYRSLDGSSPGVGAAVVTVDGDDEVVPNPLGDS